MESVRTMVGMPSFFDCRHDAAFLRCAHERAFACDDEQPDQLLVAQVAVMIVRSETERPLRTKARVVISSLCTL
jgi:hypothetical protein